MSLVAVLEVGDEGVVELPVILKGVAATGGGDVVGVIDVEGPAADIDFMGAVVEGLAGAPDAEPVPVIGLVVVVVGAAGRGSLPEIPVQRGGHGSFFAEADGFARVHIPGIAVVGAADEAIVNALDDVDGVG